MGLTRRDAGATALVAVVGALAWAYYTDQDWPLVSGPRVLAVLAFILDIMATAVGTRTMDKKLTDLTVVDRLVRTRIPGAFILMMWVAITGNEVVLGVLFGLIGVMWLGSTVFHTFSKRPTG